MSEQNAPTPEEWKEGPVEERWGKVFAAVERHDLTPLGNMMLVAESLTKSLLAAEEALHKIASGSQLSLDAPRYRLPEEVCDIIRASLNPLPLGHQQAGSRPNGKEQ